MSFSQMWWFPYITPAPNPPSLSFSDKTEGLITESDRHFKQITRLQSSTKSATSTSFSLKWYLAPNYLMCFMLTDLVVYSVTPSDCTWLKWVGLGLFWFVQVCHDCNIDFVHYFYLVSVSFIIFVLMCFSLSFLLFYWVFVLWGFLLLGYPTDYVCV